MRSAVDGSLNFIAQVAISTYWFSFNALTARRQDRHPLILCSNATVWNMLCRPSDAGSRSAGCILECIPTASKDFNLALAGLLGRIIMIAGFGQADDWVRCFKTETEPQSQRSQNIPQPHSPKIICTHADKEWKYLISVFTLGLITNSYPKTINPYRIIPLITKSYP